MWVSLALTLLLLVPGSSSGAGFFFIDVAEDAGLLQRDWSFSANVADYNNDGLQDVMIARHEHLGELWRNVGSRFVRVIEFPTRSDRHDCAWGDVNIDGALDLYCTVGADEGKSLGINELWIQDPNSRSFTNRALAYGVTDSLGRGRRTTFVNFNGDAYPDLFVGNDYPRPDGRPSPNRLFVNDGGARFVDVAAGIRGEGGANCAQAFDYDKDGWQDLLVCGKTRVFIYHNEQGTRFKEKAVALGVKGMSRDAEFADVNRDGLTDLVRINAGSLSIQYGNSSGTFDASTQIRGMSSGREVALGDADADGDLDIYALGGLRAKDFVMLNGTGTTFDEVDVPQTAEGNGDTVEPIDYNGDGKADFIAMNGGNKTIGPTQLLTITDQEVVPEAPKLFATAGEGAVCLNWSAPWNGGSELIGYRLYRDGALIADLPRVRSYRDTGVVNENTYEYRVSAVNGVGEGPRSEPVSARPSVANVLDCRG